MIDNKDENDKDENESCSSTATASLHCPIHGVVQDPLHNKSFIFCCLSTSMKCGSAGEMDSNCQQGKLDLSDKIVIGLAAAALLATIVTASMTIFIGILVSRPRLRMDVSIDSQSITVTLRNSGGSAVEVLDIVRYHKDHRRAALYGKKFHMLLGDSNIQMLKAMNDNHPGSLHTSTFTSEVWLGSNESITLLRIFLDADDDCQFTGRMVFASGIVTKSDFEVVYKTVYTGWMGREFTKTCKLG